MFIWNKFNEIFLLIFVMIGCTLIQKISCNSKNDNPHNIQTVPFINNEGLQLNISWPENLVLKHLRIVSNSSEHCKGVQCYPNGEISENSTYLILPSRINTIDADNQHECKLLPGCNYTLEYDLNNNKERYDFQIEECVETFCSCKHRGYLPKVKLNGTVISNHEILIHWTIIHNTFNSLPKNVKLRELYLSAWISTTTLSWGGKPIDSQNRTIDLYNKSKTSGETLINFTVELNSNYVVKIKGDIIDSKLCTQPGNITEIQDFNFLKVQESRNFTWIIIIAASIILVFIVSLVFNAKKIIRKIKSGTEFSNWRSVYQNVTRNPIPEISMEENCLYVDKDIWDARNRGDADNLEIAHTSLHFGSEIGKGAFGRVFIARVDNLGNKPGKQLVAVKQLKKRLTEDELEQFLGEIQTMKRVGRHPNIVNLLGCCTIKQPLLMVMEYVPCGDLLQYLRKLRMKHEEKFTTTSGSSTAPTITSLNSQQQIQPINSQSHIIPFCGKYLDLLHSSSSTSDSSYITQPETVPSAVRPSVTETMYTILSNDPDERIQMTSNTIEYVLDHKELHNFAIQIARGMKHLEDKQITHRDLAARNILIDENKTLKISDFGLSRCGIYVNTKHEKVPLRWLSIEAIRDNLYSSKSDVWAFGIVLWEIGTLGGFPYPTLTNTDILRNLIAGNRLEKPDNCSDGLYKIMRQCWEEKPEDRPTFTDLVFKLEPQKQKIYIDFDELNPNYVFPPVNEQKN